jgi:hypothetical protein
MNFLSNSYKKYFAAMATAFAVIAIPAQATDCATVCQNAAQNAGSAAGQQAANAAESTCYANAPSSGVTGEYMNNCMAAASPQINAAANAAYQQTLASCTGSCR